tara:strand:- start:9540 stop:10073 length:534 start_codon:yes stop_codon:yes gene_type:complete
MTTITPSPAQESPTNAERLIELLGTRGYVRGRIQHIEAEISASPKVAIVLRLGGAYALISLFIVCVWGMPYPLTLSFAGVLGAMATFCLMYGHRFATAEQRNGEILEELGHRAVHIDADIKAVEIEIERAEYEAREAERAAAEAEARRQARTKTAETKAEAPKPKRKAPRSKPLKRK